MKVFTAPTYCAAVQKLSKKRNIGMYSCDKDVLAEIKRFAIDELWTSNMLILERDDYKVLKIRCRNSILKYAKPAGFRFLALVTNEHVYLLTVYPKKGKYSIGNLADAEITRLLAQFAEDHAAGRCEQVWPVLDETDNLAVDEVQF